ncbi:dipeptide ABC transporter ATP-binding protein DppD [Opitutaceae bacterium EW11]|nr:dipeptide ABC transporter ATP-binding protein DppD [Opitutaceae bacterium EW11]
MIGAPSQSSAPAVRSSAPLLEVSGLSTELRLEQHAPLAGLRDVTFTLHPGRTLALVGETGSGKSMTAYSLLRLLPAPARPVSGRILLRSRKLGDLDIAALPENADVLYRIRGGVISFISQEPLTALSPVHTVGNQISEMVRLHTRASRADARQSSLEMLARVGLPNPQRAYSQYPHQLSGGMRQRAVIAMALVCRPELVIADEPTTALDVTTQAQVLALLKELQLEIGCSVMLITHDMGVVAQMADEVAVMYYGRIVEHGDVRQVLKSPLHPYTRGLLQSLPAMNTGGRLVAIPGSAPTLLCPPPGCPFSPRCSRAEPGRCDADGSPVLREYAPGHWAACHRIGEEEGE